MAIANPSLGAAKIFFKEFDSSASPLAPLAFALSHLHQSQRRAETGEAGYMGIRPCVISEDGAGDNCLRRIGTELSEKTRQPK